MASWRVHMRNFQSDAFVQLDSRDSNSFNVYATRYVDIKGVCSKWSHTQCGMFGLKEIICFYRIAQKTSFTYICVVSFKGILLRAVYFRSWPRIISKTALNAGSSKQGNANRALVGSNWVTDNQLPCKIYKLSNLLMFGTKNGVTCPFFGSPHNWYDSNRSLRQA